MRIRVSWTLVLAVFLAFPSFQRDRIEEMGFGEIFRMERMRTDPALTQALRSRWDTEAMAFVFPWGHMIPSLEDVSRITGLRVYGRPVSGFTYSCYHDIAERLLELPVERRSSLIPRKALQESLGILLFATRGDAVHCRFLTLLEDLSEVWAYLHLPGLGRGVLELPGLVPIARRWDSPHDYRSLGDQLTRLQEMIDSYPHLDVVWQPYLEEGDEGQPQLVQACPYFGRSVWLHALNLVDVTGEIASLRALLHSAVQDREAAQRQTAELRSELERVRGAGAGGASSSRSAGGSPSLLEASLAGAVLRAEEAQRHLEEQTTRAERDQLRVRAEAAEAQDAAATRELATLRVQRPPGDQEEIIWLRAELLAQQTLAWSLQQIVTDIGHSRSRSQSGASISRATDASVGQYMAGSSSRRRNEEEERHRQGEGSAQDGRGGGEMLPPPDRREGSGESGGGQ
ncbi:hypothetical protein Taro_053825 [Colocasia esculenta]|uniref:Aminotransferase-like plant mobile domain-containing protein n=1 Tax=Colocasia esculenta TaxID=4460 RepID=A0A843XPD0_COLES|nr:hypothetical protein [Colocasia esculenta]